MKRRKFEHAFIEGNHVIDSRIRAQSEGHEGIPGQAAHGRDVADINCERLQAKIFPRYCAQFEMDVLDESIDCPQFCPGLASPGGRVVSDADDQITPCIAAVATLFNQASKHID